MPSITDEMLMAYADDELDAAARSVVEARLAEDADLARRLDVFVATRRPLARIYARPMEEPVPSRLAELIYRVAPSAPTPAIDRPRQVRRSSLSYTFLSGLFFAPGRWTVALCATALLAGLAVGWQFHGQTEPAQETPQQIVASREDGLVASGALRATLEMVPSGKTVRRELGTGNAVLTPVLSFRNRNGDYCRQYELCYGRGLGFVGVACRREHDGTWRVAVHTKFESQKSLETPRSPRDDVVRPAVGKRPMIVDTVVERLIEGDVLQSEQERLLIDDGWRAGR